MPYDIDDDPYLDKDTGILRNLLGARTYNDLEEAEAEITSAAITTIMIEDRPKPDEFKTDLLLSIHRKIFSDIYDWTGNLRIREISKGVTSFARIAYLQTSLDSLFEQLKKDNYLQSLAFDDFVNALANYYSEMNVIHPFREGNGRSIRTFLALLAENAGWDIDWMGVDPVQNIAACEAAYKGDLESMILMLGSNITEYDQFWDANLGT